MSVAGWIIIAVVIVGFVTALFGLDRYRGSRKSSAGSADGAGGPGNAGSAAQPTDEVFIDPETGRKMRVWYDQRSGQREYRPELPRGGTAGPG